MKNLIQTLVLVFVITNFAFTQSNKTFIRTLTTKNNSISVDFSTNVVIKTTTGTPKINLTVETNVGPLVLDALTKSGRYDIATEDLNGVTIVTLPKTNKKVKYQESEVVEKFTCEIYLPEGTVLVEKPKSL